MRRIKELLELFHDLQGQEYDALLQDMEPWIENGAAAKNKNKAPPAKTTKGEGKIESEKTPSVLPDQGTSGGKARRTLPKLRVGYKLNLPTMTIDNYDAWYECVESCDYREVPVDCLPLDEYNKIIKECYDGVDSEEEEVSNDQEGVIDLEDYIVELQKDKEWVKKHHLCLL